MESVIATVTDRVPLLEIVSVDLVCVRYVALRELDDDRVPTDRLVLRLGDEDRLVLRLGDDRLVLRLWDEDSMPNVSIHVLVKLTLEVDDMVLLAVELNLERD